MPHRPRPEATLAHDFAGLAAVIHSIVRKSLLRQAEPRPHQASTHLAQICACRDARMCAAGQQSRRLRDPELPDCRSAVRRLRGRLMDPATRGVLEVARGVLEELDIDVLLDRVLESAQELTDARYAALGVLNEPKTELARFLTRGIDEDARATIGSLPCGRGVLGALISDPVPLRVADVGR